MVVKPHTIPDERSGMYDRGDTHEQFSDDTTTEESDEKEPTAMECIDEYFLWMAEIWIQDKSRNLFRTEELKAKYPEPGKAYKLYQRVCKRHQVTPRPPLITPKGVTARVEGGEHNVEKEITRPRRSSQRENSVSHTFISKCGLGRQFRSTKDRRLVLVQRSP